MPRLPPTAAAAELLSAQVGQLAQHANQAGRNCRVGLGAEGPVFNYSRHVPASASSSTSRVDMMTISASQGIARLCSLLSLTAAAAQNSVWRIYDWCICQDLVLLALVHGMLR